MTIEVKQVDFFEEGFGVEPVSLLGIGEKARALDLESEAGYWDETVAEIAADKGKLAQLTDPAVEIKSPYADILRGYDLAEAPAVLDVGCGPLSILGRSLDGRRVDLVGADPLSDAYGRILERNGIERPFRPVQCGAEDLTDHFAPDSFDFVYSCNALDHCADPGLAIRQMLSVCKPGRHVVFEVCMNEAVNAAYTGLHQWNFTTLDDHVLLWNPGQSVLLDHIVGGLPYRVAMLEHPKQNKKYRGVLQVTVKKLDETDFVRFDSGVSAAYNGDEGYVTIRDEGAYDPVFPCFYHGLKGSEMTASNVFRWYGDVRMRSFQLPPGETERVRIGQFDFNEPDPKTRNLWIEVAH